MEDIGFYIAMAKFNSKIYNDAELSQKIGCSKSYISQMKSGKKKISHKAFISLLELCKMSENETNALILEDMMSRQKKVSQGVKKFVEMNIKRLRNLKN